MTRLFVCGQPDKKARSGSKSETKKVGGVSSWIQADARHFSFVLLTVSFCLKFGKEIGAALVQKIICSFSI